MSDQLTFTSYNILHPALAMFHGIDDGYELGPDRKPRSNWPTRAPQIALNLITTEFDIACLQECDPTLLAHVQQNDSDLVSWIIQASGALFRNPDAVGPPMPAPVGASEGKG